MAAFVDRKGEAWEVVLTFGHLEPLWALGLDLNKELVTSGEGLGRLFALEPKVVVSALYLLCEEQIEEREVLPEKWAYLFDGPTLEGAFVALAEAVIGFFLPRETARRMTAVIRERWERTSTSSAPAGSLPDTSESTPDR